MKWVVAALLLMNAGLFGFFTFAMNQPAGSEPLTGHEPIFPEKIKILTPEELTALPKHTPPPSMPQPQTPQFSPVAAPVPAAPAVPVCYEWGSFSAVEAVRAKAAVDKLGLHAEPREAVSQEASRYWVYIPPRKSQEEAQVKMDELRALGVEDSYIVQEPVWRYAISLGVFKDEALASRYLEGLRNRGVRSAVKGRHGGLTSYVIKSMNLLQSNESDKIKGEFPGSEFKQISCQ